MTINLESVDTQLLSLPVEERARLARLLFQSLKDLDRPGPDEDFDQFWAEEATRRYEEYRAGKMGARAADEVLAEARAMLQT